MRGNPFVLCNISKAYKVYDINLTLRNKVRPDDESHPVFAYKGDR